MSIPKCVCIALAAMEPKRLCPLHASAPELYRALARIYDSPQTTYDMRVQASLALANAEVKLKL